MTKRLTKYYWYVPCRYSEDVHRLRPRVVQWYHSHLLRSVCRQVTRLLATRNQYAQCKLQAFDHSQHPRSLFLALNLGPALRKEPRSRKVDKCGTVFEDGSYLRDGGL